jgi:cobalt-zinc-cadmium efflux system membrane fusion protein
MKSKHLAPVAVLLGIIAIAVALWQWGPGIAQILPFGRTSTGDTSERKSEAPLPEGVVRLTDAQLKQFQVETGIAGSGRLRVEVTLPGEVVLNADRVAHVVPRVSGVVKEVRKNLGDTVRAGEIMAVLESRELADSTAALLAARERVSLAESNFAREEQVWQKRISPEQDYIQAKNALAEAKIELRTTEQKLRAVGFSDEYIVQLPGRSDRSTVLYEIPAPFDATVIEKHISLGEVLKDESAAFMIADLGTVWVNLDVHQKDLPLIRVGQSAEIIVGAGIPSTVGRISFLDPLATETNRTIHARVVVPNPDGRYRPGLFVNGRIVVDEVQVPILVSNETILMVDGKMCVFVKDADGFRLQPVHVGRTNGASTEILEGLVAGQVYVTKGAFTLKSELQKPEAEK